MRISQNDKLFILKVRIIKLRCVCTLKTIFQQSLGRLPTPKSA